MEIECFSFIFICLKSHLSKNKTSDKFIIGFAGDIISQELEEASEGTDSLDLFWL